MAPGTFRWSVGGRQCERQAVKDGIVTAMPYSGRLIELVLRRRAVGSAATRCVVDGGPGDRQVVVSGHMITLICRWVAYAKRVTSGERPPPVGGVHLCVVLSRAQFSQALACGRTDPSLRTVQQNCEIYFRKIINPCGWHSLATSLRCLHISKWMWFQVERRGENQNSFVRFEVHGCQMPPRGGRQRRYTQGISQTITVI
jgi:hypothetical protein